MILREILQLDVTTREAASTIGTIELEHTTGTAILADRLFHRLIFTDAGLGELLPKVEDIAEFRWRSLQKLGHRLFIQTFGLQTFAAPLEGSGDEEAQRPAALRALAEFSPADIPPADPGRAFALQQKLVRVLALDQPSVQAEADAALALFGDGPQAAERYRQAAAFAVHYPKWELWFEQMLVNQVLFEGFPYSDRRQRPAAAYSALCAAYALVRFLAVGCTVQRHDVTQLVDFCAAAFRFIAHTAFSWNAPIVLGPDGMPPALWVLVQN